MKHWDKETGLYKKNAWEYELAIIVFRNHICIGLFN